MWCTCLFLHTCLCEDVHSCVHMHVCVRMWTYVYTHACEDQRLMMGVLIYPSPPCSFWVRTSYEPGTKELNKICWQQAIEYMLSILSQTLDYSHHISVFTWCCEFKQKSSCLCSKYFTNWANYQQLVQLSYKYL